VKMGSFTCIYGLLFLTVNLWTYGFVVVVGTVKETCFLIWA